MVDLRSRGRGTGFEVGGGQRHPVLRRREVYIVFVLLVLALVALSYVDFSTGDEDRRPSAPEELVDRLSPMPLPDLDALMIEPLAELGTRDQQDIDYLLEHRSEVADRISGPSPISLHWIDQRLQADQQQRPLYQRVADEDLLRASLPAGVPVVVDGLLVDLRSEDDWHWAVVALDEERYVVAVAGSVDEAVVIGEDVRLIGRTAGSVPVGDGRSTSFLGVRTLKPRPEDADARWAGLGSLPKIGVDGQAPQIDEQELWSEIDDIHPVLELRPYYYLLGVVSRIDTYRTDPYAGARDAVATSIELHDEPSAFRGQPFQVQGRVLYSFEDQQVAEDEPYGIERVLRIVLWNQVYGSIRERTLSGEIVTNDKWVRQAFEIAVIGDEPPPPEGALIRATGRFLKVHGVPAEARNTLYEANEVTRHSDNVYFKFFVANSYEDITPAEIDWSPLVWAFLTLVPLFTGWVIWLELRDRRRDRRQPERIRRLRRTRQRLHRGGPAPVDADPAAGAADAPASDADSSASDADASASDADASASDADASAGPDTDPGARTDADRDDEQSRRD